MGKTVRTEKQENIVFGSGIFKVDSVAIGLTRDGGSFKIEYNNRLITADGDKGPVKGRINREEAKPLLTINHLELLTAIDKLHPGIKVTSSAGTKITGTGKILESDYHTVEFVGETLDGREVVIKLENAINLENIDWSLKDKDDVIDVITFTGTYDPTTPTTEPWDISAEQAAA